MNLREEPAGSRATGTKTGVVMAVLLFIAVIFVALFTYMKSQNTDIRTATIGQLFSGAGGGQVKTAETIYSIPFDPVERPAFSTYKDYLVKTGKDGIHLLDKKGAEVLSESMPLNTPLPRSNGDMLLIADVGGQDVFVLNDKGILWKDSLDVRIVNAEISEKGYVTLVTDSKRYSGEVRVYDTNGIELFRSIIANDFAVSAGISPSGRQMAVDSVDASGTRAATDIKFFDMKGASLGEKSLESSDSVFPSVFYTNSDELFAAGDRSVICFDENRELKWEKKYSGVSGACLVNGRSLAAAVDDGNGMSLKVLSAEGKELATGPVGKEVKSLRAGNGIIAAITSREIDFYNEKCRNTGKYISKSDISDIYFFSGRQAAVVTRNQVDIIDVG